MYRTKSAQVCDNRVTALQKVVFRPIQESIPLYLVKEGGVETTPHIFQNAYVKTFYHRQNVYHDEIRGSSKNNSPVLILILFGNLNTLWNKGK